VNIQKQWLKPFSIHFLLLLKFGKISSDFFSNLKIFEFMLYNHVVQSCLVSFSRCVTSDKERLKTREKRKKRVTFTEVASFEGIFTSLLPCHRFLSFSTISKKSAWPFTKVGPFGVD
jgi:hypothetical protein